MSVPGRRSPGDPIVLRELAAGRVWSGRPAIVVREPYAMEGWPAEIKIATLADLDGNYFQLMSPYEMPSADHAG